MHQILLSIMSMLSCAFPESGGYSTKQHWASNLMRTPEGSQPPTVFVQNLHGKFLLSP